jgi:hypothetical protein
MAMDKMSMTILKVKTHNLLKPIGAAAEAP